MLDVSGCSSLVSPKLKSTSLTELHLDACDRLIDDGLTAICVGCVQLTKLAVGSCASLQQPSIKGLCLLEVEMEECAGINDECIAAIDCPRLWKLVTFF